MRIALAVSGVLLVAAAVAAQSTFQRSPSAAEQDRRRDARQDAAFNDSFPEILLRDTEGNVPGTVELGQTQQRCYFARNRYTGAVVVVVPEYLSDAEAEVDAAACERGRSALASARDG